MTILGRSIKNPIAAFCVLAVYAFAYGCLNTYLPAMVTTLQKRFDLDTTRMGVLLAANDIGYFLTIFIVAYYGGHNKHVQCLVMSSVGLGLSGFILGLPFFVYGPRYSPEQLLNSNTSGHQKAFGGTAMTYTEACRPPNNGSSPDAKSTSAAVIPVSASEQTAVFVIQMIGGILNGMASTPFWNIGISFLDDITGKKSGGYIGLLLAIRCVAPIFGFMFASFLNALNESGAFFVARYAAGQKDPFWIGAWWIGFVVLAIAVLLTAPLLALFDTKALQKRIRVQSTTNIRLGEMKSNGEAGGGEKEDEADSGEERSLTKMEEASYAGDIFGEVKMEEGEPPPKLGFKDMVKVYKKLWSKPEFFLNMVGKVLECFSNVAYITFFPKFVELHFRMTATQANMTSGVLNAGSAIAGVMLSGAINQRLPLSPRKSNFFHAISNSAAALMFPFLFLFVCPAAPMRGSPQHSLNLTCTRASGCECVPTYKPVCIQGENFFSACKAACKTYNVKEQMFENCLCGSELASPGMCSDVCSLVYPYGVLLFVQRVVSIVAAVYFMKLNMSLTEKRNKPISLASVGILYGITGMAIPPFLGKLFDGACIMLNVSGTSARSFCAIYDVEKLRIYTHLFAFLPLIPSSLCYLLSWYFMKEVEPKEGEEETEI